MDDVTLTVTGAVYGQPCIATMRYPRGVWDDVSEEDREELRNIARWRFANWARAGYDTQLADENVAQLPVTAA
ncbi:hypothetical protein [Streptomyces apocyni]|uniref:hypothetical protein n=1 Tax=Streptomyces apocyni TaxID=2654677 RepID=UPI0012E9F7E8|nr:hypothetical protein [Streptomyces apocyni]